MRFAAQRSITHAPYRWGVTDNIGNKLAVARTLTTTWPLLAFLAELSLQLGNAAYSWG